MISRMSWQLMMGIHPREEPQVQKWVVKPGMVCAAHATDATCTGRDRATGRKGTERRPQSSRRARARVRHERKAVWNG